MFRGGDSNATQTEPVKVPASGTLDFKLQRGRVARLVKRHERLKELLRDQNGKESMARIFFREAYADAVYTRLAKLAQRYAGANEINRWVGATNGFLQELEKKLTELGLDEDLDASSRHGSLEQAGEAATDSNTQHTVLASSYERASAIRKVERLPVRKTGASNTSPTPLVKVRTHAASENKLPLKHAFLRKRVPVTTSTVRTGDSRSDRNREQQPITELQAARDRWMLRKLQSSTAAKVRARAKYEEGGVVAPVRTYQKTFTSIRPVRLAAETGYRMREHELLESKRIRAVAQRKWEHRSLEESKKDDLWDAISDPQQQSAIVEEMPQRQPGMLDEKEREELLADVEAFLRSSGWK